MNRERLASYLASTFAIVALTACAGDGGGTDNEEPPVRADIIEDILNGTAGSSGTGSSSDDDDASDDASDEEEEEEDPPPAQTPPAQTPPATQDSGTPSIEDILGGILGGSTGSGSTGSGSTGSGSTGSGSTGSGSSGGSCCAAGDSNCICRDDPPAILSSWPGPYGVSDFGTGAGTVYYPRDADPPFAGTALCGGFLNFGPEMSGWGTYFASWGIVTLITSTSPIDIPDIRAILLAGAVEELKRQNGDAGSPIYQKMSGRYGTAGYSMGGGGTSIAAAGDPSLKSSMGLAAWFPVGRGVSVPTLFMCGGIDAVAGCNLSDDAFNSMPNTTPKMTVMVEGVGHLSWFGPNSTSGPYGLAFQKTYLEGDSRWKARLTGLGIPRASNIR